MMIREPNRLVNMNSHYAISHMIAIAPTYSRYDMARGLELELSVLLQMSDLIKALEYYG